MSKEQNEQPTEAKEVTVFDDPSPRTPAGAWGALVEPQSSKDAWQVCHQISKSDFCPRSYKGKPYDIAIAASMGHELGLGIIRSLQTICVINGNPSMYGDGMVALIMSQPDFQDLVEDWSEEKQAWTVTCKREGRSDKSATYGMEDAKRGGLTGKPGPWKESPRRMCQWRARAYAIRDQYADVLMGLTIAEDIQHLGGRGRSRGNDAPVTLKDLEGEG